jgi:medium-chain acyl-[acyl-carrier-protein] hydrolase
LSSVSGTSGVKNNPWVGSLKPNPSAKLRLFCCPYAGGTSLVFRDWAVALDGWVEVCAIQLPGRGSRLHEPSCMSLPALVSALAAAIVPELDRPFALFGHSMGALVSFELARLLRREYRLTPLHLLVSGRRAPQLPLRDPVIYNLPESEFLREISRLNGTPREVIEHPELMQLMLPILRADFTVCETYDYAPEPPLGCRLSAFGRLQDHSVTRQDLEAWGEQTTSSFSLRLLPGDHFFLNTARPLLLQAVGRELLQHLT